LAIFAKGRPADYVDGGVRTFDVGSVYDSASENNILGNPDLLNEARLAPKYRSNESFIDAVARQFTPRAEGFNDRRFEYARTKDLGSMTFDVPDAMGNGGAGVQVEIPRTGVPFALRTVPACVPGHHF
jgi:hypothetical protein